MTPIIEVHWFEDDGRVPNNHKLPLLLIRLTSAARFEDAAAWFEDRFESYGWAAAWRWTVYPYHHFHSTNHEVLGVASGAATLLLGGENGRNVHVIKGDVIVIPAGVGHMLIDASEDFQVVGAYPGGVGPDTLLAGDPDLNAARERIAKLPLPDQDPLEGPTGPLFDYWKA